MTQHLRLVDMSEEGHIVAGGVVARGAVPRSLIGGLMQKGVVPTRRDVDPEVGAELAQALNEFVDGMPYYFAVLRYGETYTLVCIGNDVVLDTEHPHGEL
jgi:hypothetical protein